MIGSHNSFTYLKAVNGNIYNNFASFCRCQDKSIQEQYDSGVRFFDVRVTDEVYKNKTMWRVCHGKVNVNKLFASLKIAVKTFALLGDDVKIRIIYEKGSSIDTFKDEINNVLLDYKNIITQVFVKNNWQVLYENWNGVSLIDYSYVPFHSDKTLWENLKNISLSSIKKWAEKHNPQITDEMINDKTTIYFMDFV